MIIMNKEETKILSALSDSLGNGGNILQLSQQINRKYTPAYYSNIYNSIKQLFKKGILTIEEQGKNRQITLNRENPLLTYAMAEIECQKMQSLDISKDLLEAILQFGNKMAITTILTLEHETYSKISRMELLILCKEHEDRTRVIEALSRIESMHNIKIDPILLSEEEFFHIIQGEQSSPLKGMMLNKHILYNAEGFWEMIRKRKIDADARKPNKQPYDLTESELSYNYTRFGYSLYEKIEEKEKVAIEPIIFLMSTSDEARIRYGATVLIYKNISSINWFYLYYFYKRYDKLALFKGMLLETAKHATKERDEIKSIINAIPEKAKKGWETQMIKKYMKLYGG